MGQHQEDILAFTQVYNGSGTAQQYAAAIRRYAEAFERLSAG